jgi:hypothetical protein
VKIHSKLCNKTEIHILRNVGRVENNGDSFWPLILLLKKPNPNLNLRKMCIDIRAGEKDFYVLFDELSKRVES